MQSKYKCLIFYWIISFLIAITVYYVLWIIIPGHFVFGEWYGMHTYHSKHPIQYIIIPCFFYGIFANIFTKRFSNSTTSRRILLTILIIILTILASSPFGGMLYHFHDMQAGYFPENWLKIIFVKGITWGLELGWLIVGLSIPYNIIGAVVCYFLTKKGAELFRT